MLSFSQARRWSFGHDYTISISGNDCCRPVRNRNNQQRIRTDSSDLHRKRSYKVATKYLCAFCSSSRFFLISWPITDPLSLKSLLLCMLFSAIRALDGNHQLLLDSWAGWDLQAENHCVTVTLLGGASKNRTFTSKCWLRHTVRKNNATGLFLFPVKLHLEPLSHANSETPTEIWTGDNRVAAKKQRLAVGQQQYRMDITWQIYPTSTSVHCSQWSYCEKITYRFTDRQEFLNCLSIYE